jgi:hypothetical protein
MRGALTDRALAAPALHLGSTSNSAFHVASLATPRADPRSLNLSLGGTVDTFSPVHAALESNPSPPLDNAPVVNHSNRPPWSCQFPPLQFPDPRRATAAILELPKRIASPLPRGALSAVRHGALASNPQQNEREL